MATDLATVASPPPATPVERFRLHPRPNSGTGLRWLNDLREAGLDRFGRLGFPPARSEAWKYTSLRALETLPLEPVAASDRLIAPSAYAPLPLPPELNRSRLVFVDGVFDPAQSRTAALPAGVVLAPLRQVLAERSDLAEAHLGRIAEGEGQAFISLNTAFVDDGAVLHIPDGVDLETPVELVFVGHAGDRPLVWHPRILVVAGAGSRATVIEHHAGVGGASYLANGVTELALGRGARLNHYRAQRESLQAHHMAMVTAHLAQDAYYDNFVLSEGAKLSRNQIHCVLNGSGVTCRINGAYMVRGRQHCDTATFIDHAYPHCASREVYKGAIDNQARAVFQGKIMVRPDAQKTDGYQLNRALLLSEHAEIDSKPELEIYADDVKCSHGATAGDLDADCLFYLMARGIDRDSARGLLIGAFLNEAVDEMEHEAARDGFRTLVADWLKGR